MPKDFGHYAKCPISWAFREIYVARSEHFQGQHPTSAIITGVQGNPGMTLEVGGGGGGRGGGGAGPLLTSLVALDSSSVGRCLLSVLLQLPLVN